MMDYVFIYKRANPNGFIAHVRFPKLPEYTEKIRRLYWNSISEHKPIFDIYPESNESIVISNGQNRYEIEVNINSNAIYQTNSFGTSLSRYTPIGYSRTVHKEATNGHSRQEREIRITKTGINTLFVIESTITALTSSDTTPTSTNLCAFWKLRCVVKNANGVITIVEIKMIDSYRDTSLRSLMRPNFILENQYITLLIKHPKNLGSDSACYWSIKTESVSNAK